MKIVFVAGLDPLLAQGHALHVRHLVDELAGRGHQVDVLARDDGGGLEWPAPGRLLRLPRVRVPVLGQVMRELQTARLLRLWVREREADVVLTRSETLAFAPLFLPKSVPLAVELNASLANHQGDHKGLRTSLIVRSEKALLRRAGRIGVVAPALLARQAGTRDPGGDRFFVVRNGAVLAPPADRESTLALRERAGVGPQEFLLALAGSASERIEFGWLVEALEKTPGVRLWVIGQGELWSEWQERAANSGAAGRIDFLGAFSELQTLSHLQAAQAVVAPYEEGRIEQLGGDPLKVLTGMASGRPLLASGVPMDPPFDGLGAGVRVHGSPEGWIRAIGDYSEEWVRAERPLTCWPWKGEGPGRAWIRENRTWGHAAARWEAELELLRAEAGPREGAYS